jgi:hypothetical protein
MWSKPSRGVVKINVDASFHGDTLSGASGAIARDDKGDFIAAANWFIPHIQDVDAAELTTIRDGIFYI